MSWNPALTQAARIRSASMRCLFDLPPDDRDEFIPLPD
jgi:hypothetical protein